MIFTIDSFPDYKSYISINDTIVKNFVLRGIQIQDNQLVCQYPTTTIRLNFENSNELEKFHEEHPTFTKWFNNEFEGIKQVKFKSKINGKELTQYEARFKDYNKHRVAIINQDKSILDRELKKLFGDFLNRNKKIGYL